MIICEYCGESFNARALIKKIEHVNIAQSTRRHRFCSTKCKDKWCLQVQSRKSRILVIWAIGSYIDKYFFLKKHIKVRSPSLLGSETKKSFFKSNFDEIEALELVNLNGKKVLKVKT
jgi:recombinational DNA repair protein RecR